MLKSPEGTRRIRSDRFFHTVAVVAVIISLYRCRRLSDDDMVQKTDPQQFGGFPDASGQGIVRLAGGRVAAGMVVRQNKSVSIMNDGRAQDVARVGDGFIQGPRGNLHVLDEAALGVQKKDEHCLLVFPAHGRGQVVVNVLRRVEGTSCQSLSQGSGPQFKGGA